MAISAMQSAPPSDLDQANKLMPLYNPQISSSTLHPEEISKLWQLLKRTH